MFLRHNLRVEHFKFTNRIIDCIKRNKEETHVWNYMEWYNGSSYNSKNNRSYHINHVSENFGLIKITNLPIDKHEKYLKIYLLSNWINSWSLRLRGYCLTKCLLNFRTYNDSIKIKLSDKIYLMDNIWYFYLPVHALLHILRKL